jgi:flavin-dependent dehydrogenase
MPRPAPTILYGVTIIGGGLSGKAASLHLAKAGLRELCIEAAESVRQPVGESLDWSSPDLLKALGLPMDDLIGTQIATWKRHVILRLPEGAPEHYVPVPWLRRKPFNVELRTIHVDRVRLNQELMKSAVAHGVTVIQDRVVRVESDAKQISAIHTSGGDRFSSPWVIDASGFATSLLAREFNLRAVHNGPAKVAIWTYFAVPESIEGTTLYMKPKPAEYLDWIWEIPINSNVVSVGYVTTAQAMKGKRELGLSVADIFEQQLRMFPRLEPLLRVGAVGMAGPNWLIVGEAASMVDPITSNGVTAALRHAAEASALVLKYHKRRRLPLRARISYSSRVFHVARFFNGGIETVVYQPPVRNQIGLRHSGTIYISPAWGLNLLYSRLRPNGNFSTFLFASTLGFFRGSEWILYRLCKLFSPSVRTTT